MRGTILVAEDEPTVRRLIQTVLEESGYAVLAAGDGYAALALWEEHGPAVDLLLTDVNMPRMGGCELAGLLGERRPGLPLVLMSSFITDGLAGATHLPAGTHLLSKPFRPKALVRLVGQILGR